MPLKTSLDVSIVGGGSSVRDVDLERLPGTVIAVNDAAIHLPRCDVIVSMDRLWAEWRWPILTAKPREVWLRRSALQNLDVSVAPWVKVFDCDHTSTELSDDADRLNGTTSGMCAFNLAYQRKPDRVFLFGFDMQRDVKGRAYWYPPYPWTKPEGGTGDKRYSELAAQFAAIAAQCERSGIEVINASPNSAITAFRKTDEFLRTRSLPRA